MLMSLAPFTIPSSIDVCAKAPPPIARAAAANVMLCAHELTEKRISSSSDDGVTSSRSLVLALQLRDQSIDPRDVFAAQLPHVAEHPDVLRRRLELPRLLHARARGGEGVVRVVAVARQHGQL